jgi:hypothetical protein
MTRTSWRAEWEARFDDGMEPEHGIPKVHAQYPDDLADRVIETKMPDSTGKGPLLYAIEIGAVDPDHPYVRDFLDWSIWMSETMLADTERWETKWWKALRDSAHSLLTGVLALARAMRDDAEPDAALLATSRKDALAAYADMEDLELDWCGGAQKDYLQSIQFALIEGDLPAATSMIACERPYPWTQHWHDWLASLIADLNAGSGRLTDPVAIERFDRVFDLFRNPRYKGALGDDDDKIYPTRDLLRLHLALLRWKYVEGKPFAGHWRQILLSISA